MKLRLFATLAALTWALSSCSRQAEFPFLRDPPERAAIPGTYVLHPASAARLKEKGYAQLTAKIEIRSDGTFEVTSMPHWWLITGTRQGYDSCTGRWKVGIPVGSSTYDIILEDVRFSPDSVYATSEPNDPYKKNGSSPPLILGIADRTPARRDYALAVALNNGDENYLIFVRQREANKALEPTATAN